MKHSPLSPLAYLNEALAELDMRGLLRSDSPAPATPRPSAPHSSFCSNDYLGLASELPPPAPSGAGGSRLVSGDHSQHRALEDAVCSWLELPAALLFSSGYAANVGTLSALAAPNDLIVSDALNHASIIDGARLSRANIVVFPHLDIAAARRALSRPRTGRAWLVTESYFSMDADSPNLKHLRAVCDEFGAALFVDEAHALGVLGPEGRGLCAAAGVVPDVLVGTFGKAFGAGGAFVAGCRELRTWLWNRARSFVFSTGLSPATAAAAHAGLTTARNNPNLRETVLRRADELRTGLLHRGIQPSGFGHIVPWIVGESQRAVSIMRALADCGIVAQAIRPPSVPAGTARLRFTVSASHRATDLINALGVLDTVLLAQRDVSHGSSIDRDHPAFAASSPGHK